MTKKTQSSDAKNCVRTPPTAPVKVDEPNGPVGWSNESLCYMQQVYSFPDDSTVSKKESEKTEGVQRDVAQQKNFVPNRCRDDKQITVTRGKAYSAIAVGEKYHQANLDTIHERLYWGGQRLANLLIEIYGNGDKATGF